MTDTAESSASSRRILVSGDLVVDHFLYAGERMTPTARGQRGLRHVLQVGGAEGLRQLLIALSAEAMQQYAQGNAGDPDRPVACDVALCVVPPDPREQPTSHHAVAIWRCYPLDGKQPNGPKVWRVDLKMGYGQEDTSLENSAGFRPQPVDIKGHRDLLVLDDAGFVFRNQEHAKCWHLETPATTSPWILLKLSTPVGEGDLWRALVPSDEQEPGYTDHLVCLVSAHDLRQEAVRVTPRMSWEKTLEDLSDELQRPTLAPLARCRHLVVVFGGDAVLWIDRENPDGAAQFCYAPADAEGDFATRIDGEAVGYLTTMAAALAYGISQAAPGTALDLTRWMTAGLRGMRDLLRLGHGPADADAKTQPVGYPTQRLAAAILGTGSDELAQAAIAWPRPQRRSGRPWMIAESSQRPLGAEALPTLVGLASEVVRRGRPAYRALPHAQFGRFITAERSEIEMLRGIRGLMRDYRRDARTGAKPLSIGVFGPPGAGKSFAVREIADEIFGNAAWLEFNLSQFSGNAELNGALHQVRDKVLEGVIPVVFWDEFDSQEFHWLRSLLAPMQDGRFQDGALTHSVGRSVFVFAGGTSRRFAEFGEADPVPDDAPVDDARRRAAAKLQLLKVPDFKSRLDAYYDVSGPNPRERAAPDGKPVPANARFCPDPDDIGYTLRRAFMIRGQLRLAPEARLDIDADLLRALLLTPRYRHGARSLEKLVKSLASPSGAVLRRSNLPPPALLDVYVEASRFDALVDRGRAFAEDRAPQEMAPRIHQKYLDDSHRNGWPVQPHIDRPFDELPPEVKDDNIEAARRIPSILALAGLGLEPASRQPASPGPDDTTLEAHLRHNIERLAEAEHDGWWEYRRRNGWTFGSPRSDARRIHPLMVPYAQLKDSARQRDRDTVTNYPSQIAAAGFRIVWLQGDPGDASCGANPAA